MMKSAFDKIAAGMDDAIAFAKGDVNRGRVAHPVDVKAIRQANNMTQAEFAETYRIPAPTLREWEQQRRQPDSTAKVYLAMIGADPIGVRKIIEKVR